MTIRVLVKTSRYGKVLSKSSSAALFMLLALGVATNANADDIKDAKKATNAFFKKQSFTAKIDLQNTAEYHVTPDGRPSEGKDQGRFKKRLGIGARDIAFAAGKGGTGIYVYTNKRKKRIMVALLPRRGPTMHQSKLYINFGRPLEATDVTPQVIARALASYVEFTGVEVGSEINAALDQLGASEVAPAAAVAQAAATISNLIVATTPTAVTRGSSVSLDMSFEVHDAAGQTVAETRLLKLNGQTLPGFPKEYSEVRAKGNHTSRYQQPIPSNAAAGSYSYKGEVCAGGDCVSRTINFVVN